MDALRRQLAEFPELTAAEDCLVRWFRTGKRQACQVSNGQPAENTPEVRLRTSLLRALLLGQVEGVPPPESDVVIRGAWIYGDEPPPNDGSPRGAQPEIDLRSMALSFGLGFRHCHLADRLSLQGARLRGLWLDGSRLVQGVGAERAQVVGAVGLMKPAATEVLRSPEWVLCGIDQGKRRHVSSLARIAEGRRAPGQTQVDCWRDQPEGRSWPAFCAFAYSADAILPVVDLGGGRGGFRPAPASPERPCAPCSTCRFLRAGCCRGCWWRHWPGSCVMTGDRPIGPDHGRQGAG